LSAAHRSLPFGTRVKITNVDNGRSVEVLVDDRGAYSGGRCFALTIAAYTSIANIYQDQVDVTWEILDA
jgi:rare lipoprotein A